MGSGIWGRTDRSHQRQPKSAGGPRIHPELYPHRPRCAGSGSRPWHDTTESAHLLPQTLWTPARQVIRTARLNAAKHLLRTTNDPLDSIAGKTGSGSSDSLCRSFRRDLGTTPTRWRRENT
ncbi:MAG: helix-turn-helix domain-containing protein [Victivallales bacterium]|nr:helix-turn-helix domain-containing protein [Victivallales bacterium]